LGFTVLGPTAGAQRYTGAWGVYDDDGVSRVFLARNFTAALRWIAEELNGEPQPGVERLRGGTHLAPGVLYVIGQPRSSTDMLRSSQGAEPPKNSVVEWYGPVSSYATGIVSNLPPVRRVGRVAGYTANGSALIYDTDNVRAVVDPEKLTVLAEKAEDGWGKLK
jgi:hypothetical protein